MTKGFGGMLFTLFFIYSGIFTFINTVVIGMMSP